MQDGKYPMHLLWLFSLSYFFPFCYLEVHQVLTLAELKTVSDCGILSGAWSYS